MLPVPSMRDRTVAVLGLGRSGLSACRALAESGARIWAWDDADERARRRRPPPASPIVDLGLCNWARVRSAGAEPRHRRTTIRGRIRLVRRARSAGVEIIGDVELLAENQPKRRIVGITGTNGKSTTTALIGALLQRRRHRRCSVGGNIGLPVLDLLPKPCDDIYVLELSSYQLELTEHLACAVAVILNLTPDHLDRHGGMAGYVAAKKRIFRNQGASDWAVIGVDDALGQALGERAGRATRRVLPVAVGRALEHGVYVIDGRLHDAIEGPARAVADLAPIASLRGAHNWQNAAAAYAAARALGVEPRGRRRGPAELSRPRPPHGAGRRPSTASATSTTARRPTPKRRRGRWPASIAIYWIAGGRPKEGGLEPLLPWLDRVATPI